MSGAPLESHTVWDEDLLRAVAVLQLKCRSLDQQSEILSDLSDIQTHRRINENLTTYIDAHGRVGTLPFDPLGEIKRRLEKLSQVFYKISRFQFFFQDRYQSLFETSVVTSLVELTQMQKMLADDTRQFSEQLSSLEAEFSPLDWKGSLSSADLHSELLICAQGLDISLPDVTCRLEYRSLTQGEGRYYADIGRFFDTVLTRINALLTTHSEHRKTLTQVAALNVSGSFRNACQLLDQAKIGANSSCRFKDLDYGPSNQAGFQNDQVNKTIEFAYSLPNECRDSVERFAKVTGTSRQETQLDIEKANLATLRRHFNDLWQATVVSNPGSEVGQECRPPLEQAKEWIDWADAELITKEVAGSKQRKRMFHILVASILVAGAVVIFLMIANNILHKARVFRATKESPFVNSLGMKFVPVPGTRVLFSIWDTRVDDFRAYVMETGYVQQGKMYVRSGKEWMLVGTANWEMPGFQQTTDHPVVGVSWEESKAFCQWLTAKERKKGRIGMDMEYRLPTDEEWSAAAGTGEYPWGDEWPPPKEAGNYNPSLGVDFYENTSPCGKLLANQYGLYDMGGNVWQWCEDWYRAGMNEGAVLEKYPALKEAVSGRNNRVVRGGCWYIYEPETMLSSFRHSGSPDSRSSACGFRCVLFVGSSGSQNNRTEDLKGH